MPDSNRIFPKNITIPSAPESKIASKIKVSSGIPEAESLRQTLMNMILQARESSELTASYINFLFHHPDFSINLIHPHEAAEGATAAMAGYVLPDGQNASVYFIYSKDLFDNAFNDTSTKISRETIAHEFYHALWLQLKRAPRLNTSECFTHTESGTPLARQTISNTEKMRQPLADTYKRFLELYTKIDQNQPLTAGEQHFVNTTPTSISRKLVAIGGTSKELSAAKHQHFDGITGYGLHLRSVVRDDKLYATYTCPDQNQPKCRAMQMLGHMIYQRNTYEQRGARIDQILAKQFSPEELNLFQALRKAGFKTHDPRNAKSYSIATEVIKRRGNAIVETTMHVEIVSKTEQLSNLNIELDTIIREYPHLLQLPEVQDVLSERQEDLAEWLACSPDSLKHIPKIKTKQQTPPSIIHHNACLAKPTGGNNQLLPSVIGKGLGAFVTSLFITAMRITLKRNHPRAEAFVSNFIKLMIFVSMIYDENYVEATFMAAGELADRCGHPEIAMGLYMAGLFTTDDSGDSSLTVATTFSSGVAGQMAAGYLAA
jgi:hypothetical protein